MTTTINRPRLGNIIKTESMGNCVYLYASQELKNDWSYSVTVSDRTNNRQLCFWFSTPKERLFKNMARDITEETLNSVVVEDLGGVRVFNSSEVDLSGLYAQYIGCVQDSSQVRGVYK